MLVASCDVGNVDPATGACSQVVWVEQPQFLPPLSADDGLTIGTAILGCWAVGFCWRTVIQFLNRSASNEGES